MASNRNKALVLRTATLVVAVAICLAAWLAARPQPAGAPRWYSIVPPLIAVSLALVTMAVGLVIFIDDYANTMIVGPTLRPVTDRQLISREKLAFLVDATAAPVAGIALVSTWIGYEVGLLSDIARSLGVDKGGYEIFLDALGFRFYCFGMISFVFFNCYSGEDFGPMAAAERRARKYGKLLDDDATVMTSASMTSAAS